LSAWAERLRKRYFRDEDHPYHVFEREIAQALRPEHTLLDAGCGATVPVLGTYRGKAKHLIGVDLVNFDGNLEGIELHTCDLASIPVASGSVDLIISRSVLEHVTDPAKVYAEMHRLLRPGGRFIFLTPNLWDYGSLVARIIPNRFHPWIVSHTEGRAEHDVFPVVYRTNTRAAVQCWARGGGFEVTSLRYLGQYPSYFMFNGALFLLATGYEKVISRFEGLRGLRGWILVTLTKAGT
jgi:SAM-dependent methyltransferase